MATIAALSRRRAAVEKKAKACETRALEIMRAAVAQRTRTLARAKSLKNPKAGPWVLLRKWGSFPWDVVAKTPFLDECLEIQADNQFGFAENAAAWQRVRAEAFRAGDPNPEIHKRPNVRYRIIHLSKVPYHLRSKL